MHPACPSKAYCQVSLGDCLGGLVVRCMIFRFVFMVLDTVHPACPSKAYCQVSLGDCLGGLVVRCMIFRFVFMVLDTVHPACPSKAYCQVSLGDCLGGLVVRLPTCSVGDLRIAPRFPLLSHTSDLKNDQWLPCLTPSVRRQC